MITDEEVKKAAEVLVEYCREHVRCVDCPMEDNCVLGYGVCNWFGKHD